MSEQTKVGASAAQAVEQGGIFAKLLVFAALLAIAPIASYFLSKDYLWDGNTVFAAITAIIAANAVLIGYIIVSIREERLGTTARGPAESKKNR
ncbi:uncharacterized protein FIBRA_07013 [Fibroporia radiculosa]|uniref:Vacuolar ATPase assembly integral membrane protein VMA21 n=1 Tax=Fibroporia radiculosa TaxID=599839 RepID=J4GU53_9APHY|nr:uncharacterized protein FIBRA_07013 [Fibroporia radiculosa]CCM04820.1 predicted protein [Fibroporia radiculosa]